MANEELSGLLAELQTYRHILRHMLLDIERELCRRRTLAEEIRSLIRSIEEVIERNSGNMDRTVGRKVTKENS